MMNEIEVGVGWLAHAQLLARQPMSRYLDRLETCTDAETLSLSLSLMASTVLRFQKEKSGHLMHKRQWWQT